MKRPLIAMFLLFVAAACGKDDKLDIPCTDEEYWDQVNAECVPRFRDQNSMANSDTPDMAVDMSEEPDMAADMDNEPTNIFNPSCDADNDGELSIECGGEDCDDGDPLRKPGNPEFCDEIDNDCDDVINEGVICTFYAHSSDALYEVDPFSMTLQEIANDLPDPALRDIDTHPSGALLGVTTQGLYQYDDLRDYWFQVGDFGNNAPSSPNGMAVDLGGRIFVTSDDELYEVDILDGQATLVGNLGGDYVASGDCVVNKQDSLYMTSKKDGEPDKLLLLNRQTAAATEIGSIGFTDVFALTAAWGRLYGLTADGGLIQIDPMTGEGALLHEFQGTRFFGAASTPAR